MKKKLFLLLTILCCLALSVGILAACDSESGKQDDGTSATYYTVTFDSQGGSPVNAVEVESGKTVPKPSPDPTKADADFVGWYKDAACTAGNEYDFSAPVTSDIKL
ncbi:MAG: InlB B-repeat-containing protein [Christensenellales bacterium]|nr:InlB B-repeat-containing protein [Christensenellales bacterium]